MDEVNQDNNIIKANAVSYKETRTNTSNRIASQSLMTMYMIILFCLFCLITVIEIVILTSSTDNTTLLGNLQLALLVTGVLLSGILLARKHSSSQFSISHNPVRQLNDRIALKSHSLEILYDAAAGVTDLHGLDQLLTRFLITLKNLTHAQAAIVRLLTDENNMRLVANTGINNDTDKLNQLVSLPQCMVGTPIADSIILTTQLDDIWFNELPSLQKKNLTVITIPIQYSGKTLGVYHFIVDKMDILEQNEIIQLFSSIGRHLGIVVEKVNLENHSRRISIIEERTSLANELHDSLAQTLASLRFQATMVDETVSQSKDRTGIKQIHTIKDGIEQANNQLRELLSHFRTRMDERGLIPAIEALVERFEKSSGISAFFQNEVKYPNITPAVEVQVLHIVQEALTNVRKHSQAENVRVLIRSDDKGNYHVLVEDDGQGIQDSEMVARPGEHIGLSIMKERAERLRGNLSIETEPGEGTRVELSFRAQSDRRKM